MISHWRKALPENAGTVAWLDHLEEIGDPDFEVTLPPALELAPVLVETAVPHEDIDPMLAGSRALGESAKKWFLLRRCVHALVRTMGQVGDPPFANPEQLGPYFFPYVYLATMPHTKAYHRELGIPERISRETFADLGRNMAVHRMRAGRPGLNAPYWMMNHARGVLYQLGRLQFERVHAGARTSRAIAAAGNSYQKGDPILSVHVPEFYGSITPEACDDSFARAREFFPRHFPLEPYEFAACYSWLLDDQLAEYLPATSNIIRFQRRFARLPPRASRSDSNDDADIVQFVFGQDLGAPEDLPQRTTLERAIRSHLIASRHWNGAAGWVHLGK